MFSISPIKAFRDNYIWLITLADNRALVVDPGDASVVIATLDEHKLTLTGILLTHHHHDHSGGIAALKERSAHLKQALTVYGPAQSIHTDIGCFEGDMLNIDGLDASIRVLEVPGHTLDHLAFILDDALFCGDALFSGGCGRLFEGTPSQLYDSLGKLKALADETRVYCAHEYTAANLKFAMAAEPDNIAISTYATKVDDLTVKGIPSLPSTLGQEKAINPFLRTNSKTIQQTVANQWQQSIDSELHCLTLLRQWKDKY